MATTVNESHEVAAALIAFSAAADSQDLDAVMATMTEDCVWENNEPAPDGERAEGQAAVRAIWERLFRTYPTGGFTLEEFIPVAVDRAVVRWNAVYADGNIRGIDVFRVREGKIAEKLTYVKGPLPA
jgi:ketosteroid isomerase-like protein